MSFQRVVFVGGLLLLQVVWLGSSAAIAQVPLLRESPQRRLARLLIKRAKLRDAQTTPDLEGAINDANEALGLDANLASAYVVLGNAHLSKSRRLYSYAKKLDELGQAAAACDEAQKRLDAGDDLTRMDLYLVRSYALVEHANYVHDETFQQQEKDLLEAIDGAKKAAELQASRPLLAPGGSDRPGDYPDLAMGNAYEDLAWIVDKDPPGNYRQAVEAFKRAGEKAIIAHASQVSVGRCYYRIATQSFLEPEEFAGEAMKSLGIDSNATALSMAKDAFSAAVDSRTADSEAQQYLAMVFALYKDDVAADEHFQAAVQASPDGLAKASNRFSWALSCLSRTPPNPGKAESLAGEIDACQTADEDCLDPKKESSYVRAQIRMLQKDEAGALAILDAALLPVDRGQVSRVSVGHAYLLDLRGLVHFQQAQQAGASAPGDSGDQAVKHYEEAIADFEREVEGVNGRFDLMKAHRWAALSACLAYLTTLKPAPSQPALLDNLLTVAEGKKYYAKIVDHLAAVDRVWHRRQEGPLAIYCHTAVAKMFGERAGYINSKKLAQALTKPERDLAVRWMDRLVTLDAANQAQRREQAAKLTAALDQALAPPPPPPTQ